MDRNQIFIELKKIISPFLKELNDFEMDDHLTDDLGIDSLDLIDILFKIEEEFNLNFKEQDIAKLSKVEDAVDLIYDKRKAI